MAAKNKKARENTGAIWPAFQAEKFDSPEEYIEFLDAHRINIDDVNDAFAAI